MEQETITNDGMLCTYPNMGRIDCKVLEVREREEDFQKRIEIIS